LLRAKATRWFAEPPRYTRLVGAVEVGVEISARKSVAVPV
jgi:hypothetical protein